MRIERLAMAVQARGLAVGLFTGIVRDTRLHLPETTLQVLLVHTPRPLVHLDILPLQDTQLGVLRDLCLHTKLEQFRDLCRLIMVLQQPRDLCHLTSQAQLLVLYRLTTPRAPFHLTPLQAREDRVPSRPTMAGQPQRVPSHLTTAEQPQRVLYLPITVQRRLRAPSHLTAAQALRSLVPLESTLPVTSWRVNPSDLVTSPEPQVLLPSSAVDRPTLLRLIRLVAPMVVHRELHRTEALCHMGVEHLGTLPLQVSQDACLPARQLHLGYLTSRLCWLLPRASRVPPTWHSRTRRLRS